MSMMYHTPHTPSTTCNYYRKLCTVISAKVNNIPSFLHSLEASFYCTFPPRQLDECDGDDEALPVLLRRLYCWNLSMIPYTIWLL